MLVDTDVLVDYLRGESKAEEFIESNLDEIHICSITVAELYQGVIEEEERSALDSMMSALIILPIANEGGIICRQYRKSHNSGLADSIIAATARHHNLPLRTLNIKLFPMLENASSPYRKS